MGNYTHATKLHVSIEVFLAAEQMCMECNLKKVKPNYFCKFFLWTSEKLFKAAYGLLSFQ